MPEERIPEGSRPEIDLVEMKLFSLQVNRKIVEDNILANPQYNIFTITKRGYSNNSLNNFFTDVTIARHSENTLGSNYVFSYNYVLRSPIRIEDELLQIFARYVVWQKVVSYFVLLEGEAKLGFPPLPATAPIGLVTDLEPLPRSDIETSGNHSRG